MQMKNFALFSLAWSCSAAASRAEFYPTVQLSQVKLWRFWSQSTKSHQYFNRMTVLKYWGLLVKVIPNGGKGYWFSLTQSNCVSPFSASVTVTMAVLTSVSSMRSAGSWSAGVLNSFSEKPVESSVWEKTNQTNFPPLRRHCCCVSKCKCLSLISACWKASFRGDQQVEFHFKGITTWHDN